MVGNCECGNEPSGFFKCGEFIRGPVSFLGRTLFHGVSYSVTLSGAHTGPRVPRSAVTGDHLMSFTQEIEVDLHSLVSLLTLATVVRGKQTGPVRNMSVYPCMTFALVHICKVYRL